jgi:hypothetical protein
VYILIFVYPCIIVHNLFLYSFNLNNKEYYITIMCKKWVYVLKNTDKEYKDIYVGETLRLFRRFNEHLEGLLKIQVIIMMLI